MAFKTESNIAQKSKLTQIADALRTTFCEFCDNSSINGLQYITERRLHWTER